MISGPMTPLKISDYTLVSALGAGVDSHWSQLENGQTGLSPCEFYNITDLQTWVGEVKGLDSISLKDELLPYDCRNNRLAQLGLEQDGFLDSVHDAIRRYGAERVGVLIGTSTSGIHQTELAYMERASEDDTLPSWYRYDTTHDTSSVAEFVRRYTGCEGICTAISTACSSSAKVFASAYRAIHSGLCDAVVVGGVDSLCLTTLYGFNSLQLVAADICRPSDVRRNGISIGEAAGFALLERPQGNEGFALLGYGESSDAYHMSSPHPQGDGAVQAMQAALDTAGITAADIDYINLHGTATPTNDLSESLAVKRLFSNSVLCSSTKGWTGHTLGAAGIVEAVFSILSLKHGFIPKSLNTEQLDPAVAINIAMENHFRPVEKVLSNSFGFGGSNCSLVFGELS